MANKFIGEEQCYIFNQEGFSVKSKTSSAKLEWSKIYKIEETKNLLFIFISNMQAFIIPKNNFTRINIIVLNH